MDAANLHKSGSGELVLQNGRQAGVRRPLGSPTTFIGRNQDCDIRLNVEGVDPMHCLLVFGEGGMQLRDLNSVSGTYVNGIRAENVPLQHGDVLKVGPFQFRVELPARAVQSDETPVEEYRQALRVQVSAVAAQQAGLEEEEARLQQRRSDLEQQEEQLAAHLAEKQRQVQLWSEYTKAERETLRKEKIDQDKHLDKLEQELAQAKHALAKDHEKLTLERQRINKVYQRLRQRWQRQWSAEQEKYQKIAKQLQADALAVEERDRALDAREASLKQDVLRFNTERELGTRQLHEDRDALKKAQDGWRRRRSHEYLVLKGMQRRTDEAQLKLAQARQILMDEKGTWDRQLDSLQKELHGLNNRIVHQRLRAQERAEEIARRDAVLRDRQRQLHEEPMDAIEIVETEEVLPECEVAIVTEDTKPAPHTPLPNDDWQRRFDGLDRMAGELADQRMHLIEQYNRLAEIQDDWQHRRDQAAAELESLAERLIVEKQSLDQREQKTDVVETLLAQRQQEIETVREEIHIWRAQLKAREQTFEQEHEKQMFALRQKETLLQEQLTGLQQLRKRWNERRQAEIDQLRSKRAALEEDKKETQKRRIALFEKSQQVEEEKRILSEKALALEQYRQEVFIRAKDPAAQRRVERLRRRWLTLNAALIRNAKTERESTKKDLRLLETERVELLKSVNQLTQSESAAAEHQALLDEREAVLKARQMQVELELRKLDSQRHDSNERSLRIQDEIDTLAKAVFEEPDAPAIDKAA
jgi:pSer/pThr/pTyr-binding forkhead associated (FHA) protein